MKRITLADNGLAHAGSLSTISDALALTVRADVHTAVESFSPYTVKILPLLVTRFLSARMAFTGERAAIGVMDDISAPNMLAMLPLAK